MEGADMTTETDVTTEADWTGWINCPLAEDGKIRIDHSGSPLPYLPVLGALELTRRLDGDRVWPAYQTDDSGLDYLISMSNELLQGLSRYTRSVSHLLACADHKELPDYVLSDIAWLLEGLAALAEQVTWTRCEASTQLYKKDLIQGAAAISRAAKAAEMAADAA
jgi:hypothetical protein